MKFTLIQRRHIRVRRRRGRRRSHTQSALLYGYGGHANINARYSNASDDNGLTFFLDQFSMQETAVVLRDIEIKNCGDLTGFVYGTFEMAAITPFAHNVNLYGWEIVLRPQETRFATVIVVVDELFKYFNETDKDVEFVDLGLLKVYTGAEVLRGRLRRMMESVEENKCVTIPLELVKELTASFPFEQPFPEDINDFLEPPHEIDQLLQRVFVTTIPLRIRRCK